MAFIYTARALPTVSVADRNRTGRTGTNPAQAILASMQESTGRRTQRRPGAGAGRAGRTSDWAVGSEEFQRQYRVRANDGRSAEWLAGPALQQALLGRRPAISITSNGADILARTDYGWTDRDGVTDYGGTPIKNVQDLDIVTIEALSDTRQALVLICLPELAEVLFAASSRAGCAVVVAEGDPDTHLHGHSARMPTRTQAYRSG